MVRALAYTLAGLITSASVGAGIGAVGYVAIPVEGAAAAGLVAGGLVVALLLRELGAISLPLPIARRQTVHMWARLMPPVVSATFWGLDLGLSFSTYITFSGAWALAASATAVRSPAFGALLFAAYWIGRTLAIWLRPWIDDHPHIDGLAQCIVIGRSAFRRVHLLALTLAAGALVVSAGFALRAML